MKYAVFLYRDVRQRITMETEAVDSETACQRAADEAALLPDAAWGATETVEIGWEEWERVDEFTE